MEKTIKTGTVRRRQRIVYAVLILYCGFNVLQFLLLISGSLKGKTEIFSSGIWSLPETPVWKNYTDAWNISNIGRYTLNSLYVTGITLLLLIIIGSMAAYILGRVPFEGSGLVMAFIMAGMMIPPFVIAVPLFNILQKLGMLNNLNGLVLVYTAKQLPFTIFVLTSFYKGLPFDLEEAAIIDGASPVRTFAHIMFPLTMPAVVSVSINNLINVWNEFLLALIFISKKKFYTLPIGLFHLSQAAEYSSAWTVLFAGMVISIVPILIIFAIFQKQFATGVAQGAVKG